MKNKANKGWIKELSKPKVEQPKHKPFKYTKPLVTPQDTKSVSFKANSREHRTKSNLITEQSAHLDHKGKLNGSK